MHVVIIDYAKGNLHSVGKAVARAAEQFGGEVSIVISGEAEEIKRADRLILPGVGAFAACMDGINAVVGLREALDEAVIQRKIPILGICVGMQVMATHGHEFGITEGLGWIKGIVAKMNAPSLPIPHMSWQEIQPRRDNPIIDHMWGYFVHSFVFVPDNSRHILATSNYGSTFVAAVQRENIVGTQFHPEKSQRAGIALLVNFLRWNLAAA